MTTADPRPAPGRGLVLGTIGLALLLALGNAVWLLIDRTAPSFDQASYLRVTILYNEAVGRDGLDALFSTVHDTDPGRGPLYQVALMPWLAVFGEGPRSALLYNSALAVLLYLAAGDVARQVFGTQRARIMAMVLVALTPLMVGLQHEVLVDFQLTTLACLAVAFLLRSDGFTHTGFSILCGVAIGLGTLTKVTFPSFVLGPVLVAVGLLVVRSVRRPGRPVGRAWLNLAVAGLASLAFALPWYLNNRDATIEYVRSTTSGPLSKGAGPEQPLTWHNMVTFVVSVVDQHVGLVLALTAVAVLALTATRLVSRLRAEGGEAWPGALMLVTWAGLPFLLLLTGHNQDVRLMAPAVAAFSIGVAGGLSHVRPTALRNGLTGVVVALLAFQALNRTVSVAPSWLPDEASVMIGDQTLWTPVESPRQIGYQKLPQRDRATPIYQYVRAQATVGVKVQPATICMLATHPVVNGNTFNYLIAAHDDPFTVVEVMVGPEGPEALPAQLAGCTFAFYIKPPPGAVAGTDRLSLVNRPYASGYMTPALLASFDGPSRSFPIGAKPVSQDPDADPAPDPSRVRVLAHRTS